jgi:hypothetical protein
MKKVTWARRTVVWMLLRSYFFYYYLFSDVLDDGKNFLIEELRGLART